MMGIHTRTQRRELDRQNRCFPAKLVAITRDVWPPTVPPGLTEVWRSRDFLVQIFEQQPARTFGATFQVAARLSVCRTALSGDRWKDGISWDDLQRLKSECGFGAFDAVEIFPRDLDVVNVANMRHLWVMADPLPFAWRDRKSV
jgi:hypothetical protein